MSGLPDLLEELDEYETMYNTIPEGWEYYPGKEGEFAGYKVPFRVDVAPLIRRLRDLYREKT